MEIKEQSLRFERMIEALVKSAYDSGKMALDEIYPIHPIESYPYFMDFFIEALDKKIKFIEKENIKLKPSRIWNWIVNILLGSKMSKVDKEKVIYLVNRLLDLLEKSMEGNCFCEDKTHRIIKPDIKWIKTDAFTEKIKKEISKLHAQLMCYNQTLYWVLNCAFREIHGSYKVMFEGKPAQLIIREYFNLNLKGNKLPFNYVKTETIYDKDINFDFFVLNDFLWDKKIEDHMLDSKCFFDDKEIVNFEEIKYFSRALGEANKQESYKIFSLSREEKILGLVERFYKTLNDVGESIDVPIKIVKERLKNPKLDMPPQKLDRETVKILFNPAK